MVVMQDLALLREPVGRHRMAARHAKIPAGTRARFGVLIQDGTDAAEPGQGLRHAHACAVTIVPRHPGEPRNTGLAHLIVAVFVMKGLQAPGPRQVAAVSGHLPRSQFRHSSTLSPVMRGKRSFA